MMVYLLQMFGISLILTLFIEGCVAFLCGSRKKKAFLLIVLVNVLTNPAAVLVYWLYRMYVGDNTMLVQILIEIAVVWVEAYIYRSFSADERFQIYRPIRMAILANVLSWGIGRFL